jgi:hypothetical protein
VLKRILLLGERFDLLLIDESFEPSHLMLGSTAIKKLRGSLAARVMPVVILCSGVDPSTTKDKSASLDTGPDAVWLKPCPDWRGGEMQHELSIIFAKKQRPFTIVATALDSEPSRPSPEIAEQMADESAQQAPEMENQRVEQAGLGPDAHGLPRDVRAMIADDNPINRK